MKKSELKEKLRKESKERFLIYENFQKRMQGPHVYKNMICPNIKNALGFTCGHDLRGVFGQIWNCSECGRSGTNYDKNSLRKIDTLIEEKCDLED